METLSFAAKNHDLSLPAWGPYGKQYAGLSYIADKRRGVRFDLNVFPALYRRRIDIPNVNWESGFHPWESAPNFDYFSYRHEILWKDQLYADISYAKVEAFGGRLIRCEIVNRTKLPYLTALHTMASMHYPAAFSHAPTPMSYETPELPDGGILQHGLDYAALEWARPAANDHLSGDGFWRGEIRGNGFLDGSALGQFGRDTGDLVRYRFDRLPHPSPLKLILRARLSAPSERTALALGGLASGRVEITSPAFENVEIPLTENVSSHQLLITSERNVPIDIAWLAIVPADTEAIAMRSQVWNPIPERLTAPLSSSLVLSYPNLPGCYGIAWDGVDYEVRQILSSELDSFLRFKTHDHIHETLVNDRKGHFTNIVQRPLHVPAQSSRVLWSFVCTGEQSIVEEALKQFAQSSEKREALMARAAKTAFSFKPSPAGKKYLFSQNRMAATTLTNIVFPVYTQRQYLRHRCPGRWWDCLYTWDSGFIGLGLLEMAPDQAAECLGQYLTAPGNPHAAFIHHGSLMPVQAYLYQELWNRTQSRALLEKYYDSLRQYYLFYAGHANGSTTRNLKSNLLRSWDYFYNSGGWDDYVPQAEVHRQQRERSITPAVTSAQAIRFARILSLAASHMGRTEDLPLYEKDIQEIGDALNRFSWDSDAGYYSYVVHDANGEPEGIFRNEQGVNLNRGLDGVHPLTAGICNASQTEMLIGRLFNPEQLWSPIGLTAIDQSAPYYRPNGYWNGTVWFAHQWFFWKTMLDLGRSDLAYTIAIQALETWSREVNESYNCFEHFAIESGRGCGWHQFSALSTPVLSFFSAAHCPGRLTTGFDAWVLESKFSERNSCLQAFLRLSSRENQASRSIWISLNPNFDYSVYWRGHEVISKTIHPGLLALDLPADGQAGTLKIQPKTTSAD